MDVEADWFNVEQLQKTMYSLISFENTGIFKVAANLLKEQPLSLYLCLVFEVQVWFGVFFFCKCYFLVPEEMSTCSVKWVCLFEMLVLKLPKGYRRGGRFQPLSDESKSISFEVFWCFSNHFILTAGHEVQNVFKQETHGPVSLWAETTNNTGQKQMIDWFSLKLRHEGRQKRCLAARLTGSLHFSPSFHAWHQTQLSSEIKHCM